MPIKYHKEIRTSIVEVAAAIGVVVETTEDVEDAEMLKDSRHDAVIAKFQGISSKIVRPVSIKHVAIKDMMLGTHLALITNDCMARTACQN